jgi:hypothetical protein
MINVKRNKEVPQSLGDPVIQQYLDDLEVYREDQQRPKDEQTVEKPECNKSYRAADLFKAFDECFLGKCYLTELKYETSWAMDVEHFIPQNEQPELKYVWTNLYPASHDANMMKPNKTPEYGYLDPCTDDVETAIVYSIGPLGEGIHFKPLDKTHTKSINTAKLLIRLHNGHDEATKSKTIELRNSIRKRYTKILRTIDDWRYAVEQGNVQEEADAEGKLKRYLSRNASFTMLMRSALPVRRIIEKFDSDFLD